MTARLNRLVKMTNILVNRFSSGSFSRKYQFSEFDHLFANWFFVDKERSYTDKNRVKLKVCNPPKHLISTIFKMAFIQKMELASKFFRSPIEKGILGIIALQLCSINRIFSSFLHSLSNVQTAFGIYEPSKIGIVNLGRDFNVPDGLYVFFERMFNDVSIFFKNFHGLNEREPFVREFRIPKAKKNVTFVLFFNKKGSYSWKKFIAFFGKHKMVRWKPVFLSRFFDMDIAVKMIFKPLNVINMSGNYGKGVLKKWRRFNFSNKKATVPINVTSRVGQPCLIHA